jgi:hypothetical protein
MVCFIDDSLKEKKMTIHAVSVKLNIPHYYYTHWKKMLEKVDKIENNCDCVPFNINGDSRQIHPSCPSLLEEIRDTLVHVIFKLQEQGPHASSS